MLLSDIETKFNNLMDLLVSSFQKKGVDGFFNSANCIKENLGITEKDVRELNDESVFYCNHADLKKATKALGWLTFFEPTNPSHHLRLGVVLSQQEKYKEALKSFSIGSFLSPQNPKFFLYMGTCFLMLEEKEEAKKAFTKAIDLSKGNENYKEVFALAKQAIPLL